MFNAASMILFLIFINSLFSFSFTNANPSEIDDKLLKAFMKGVQEKKISEYSLQKYEAHLGILYFLRKNWQCDKIRGKFDEFERTECQKYRKYLDILYEYLFREYAGIPIVKPIFVFKKNYGITEIEIEGPIFYVVLCLATISAFYFECNESYKNLISESYIFEPILLNEEKLDYLFKFENEQKLPINEMVLQLAIETANEWQTNESAEGIIRQKFEENLEKMLIKAEEKAKKENPWNATEIINDKHQIIVYSKFDDSKTWTYDALFSEYVKGQATNNLEKFRRLLKGFNTQFLAMNLWAGKYQFDAVGVVFFMNWQYDIIGEQNEEFEIEVGRKYEEFLQNLQQKYKAHLCVVHLMQKNWQCDKIKMKEDKRKKCQTNRKYLDILYEYLFRLYAEAKNPKLLKQLPPFVKPIFIEDNFHGSLIGVIRKLNHISNDFWKKGTYDWVTTVIDEMEMDLLNKDELNYAIKGKKIGENASKNETETNIAKLRKEFEQKMKNTCENVKENIKEAQAKFKKEVQNTNNRRQDIDNMRNEYNDIFGIFD